MTFWRSCSAIPESLLCRSETFTPGVVRALATDAPFSAELRAIVPTFSM